MDKDTGEAVIPEEIEKAMYSSQIIIDGKTMVVSMGWHQKAETFGNFGRNRCKECNAL